MSDDKNAKKLSEQLIAADAANTKLRIRCIHAEALNQFLASGLAWAVGALEGAGVEGGYASEVLERYREQLRKEYEDARPRDEAGPPADE